MPQATALRGVLSKDTCHITYLMDKDSLALLAQCSPRSCISLTSFATFCARISLYVAIFSNHPHLPLTTSFDVSSMLVSNINCAKMTQSHKLHLINEIAAIAGIAFYTEEQAYEVHPSDRDKTIDDLNQEIRESWSDSRAAGYFDVALARTCSERQFKTETWRHHPLNAFTTAKRRALFGNRSPEEMDESNQRAAEEWFAESASLRDLAEVEDYDALPF